MIIVTSNVFRPHENEKPAFSNSSGLKSFFEKLYFRDGLACIVGRTEEIQLRFQISGLRNACVGPAFIIIIGVNRLN